MMMKKKPLAVLIGQVFGMVALAAATGVVQAQQAAPERITVTGSRIPQMNLESNSPVTIIGAEDIKMDGITSTENLLNNLPQVFADQGGSVSNGASGIATVNLRNLGADRTLVLINGRRLPAGSPTQLATDLNQIPTPLIKRVEVLTGGASAIYGSDAVAGVVNFIMNDKFEGVQVDINRSAYNHQQGNSVADTVRGRNFPVPGNVNSDGRDIDANLLMGGNFAGGRGNATLSFNYKKQDELLQAQRDFSACALSSNAAGFTCGGSSTTYPGRFYDQTTGKSYTIADASGNTRAFKSATDQFNYAPLNAYLRPTERYGFNAFANYDVAPKAKVYSEFGFHDDHTVAQIAPSGSFFGGNTYTISGNNPLLSPGWFNTLFTSNGLGANSTNDLWIGRRNIEGGGRQDDIRHTSYRGVFGVKGEVASNWNYDAFAQYGKVVYQETYLNDFSNTRLLRAMNVVKNPATGAAVCQSVLDGTDPNCVPYNIWSLGGVTPAALAYLQTPGLKKGFTSQSVYGFNMSSDLGAYGVKSPLANNGVSVAFGAEYRKEKMDLATDVEFTTGDLSGQGGPTISSGGSYHVTDLFVEVRAPLIERREFAHLLSLNASYRNSDYNTGIKSDSYGLGLDWAPVKEAKFRGSYQRAVRAANIIEMFQPQGLNLYNNDSDPCAGATPTASLAACQKTGVTAAQYGKIVDNPAGQYNFLQGGNPALKPEKSDSYTLGLVLTPLKNLSATIDYFNMKVKDVISILDPVVSLNQCLASGDPTYCSLITRDSQGTLWANAAARIVGTNVNIGERKTSGVDLAANYSYRMDTYGSLAFNFMGTWLKKWETVQAPGISWDCVGYHGSTCGTPTPKWRHKLRASWTTPWDADLAVTWRHIDKVENQGLSSNPNLTGAVNAVDRELKAMDYLDVAASWAVTKQITLRGGINNLLDKDPPVVNATTLTAAFGNGNTYPQVYDALGRYMFVNLTAKF